MTDVMAPKRGHSPMAMSLKRFLGRDYCRFQATKKHESFIQFPKLHCAVWFQIHRDNQLKINHSHNTLPIHHECLSFLMKCYGPSSVTFSTYHCCMLNYSLQLHLEQMNNSSPQDSIYNKRGQPHEGFFSFPARKENEIVYTRSIQIM